MGCVLPVRVGVDEAFEALPAATRLGGTPCRSLLAPAGLRDLDLGDCLAGARRVGAAGIGGYEALQLALVTALLGCSPRGGLGPLVGLRAVDGGDPLACLGRVLAVGMGGDVA